MSQYYYLEDEVLWSLVSSSECTRRAFSPAKTAPFSILQIDTTYSETSTLVSTLIDSLCASQTVRYLVSEQTGSPFVYLYFFFAGEHSDSETINLLLTTWIDRLGLSPVAVVCSDVHPVPFPIQKECSWWTSSRAEPYYTKALSDEALFDEFMADCEKSRANPSDLIKLLAASIARQSIKAAHTEVSEPERHEKCLDRNSDTVEENTPLSVDNLDAVKRLDNPHGQSMQCLDVQLDKSLEDADCLDGVPVKIQASSFESTVPESPTSGQKRQRRLVKEGTRKSSTRKKSRQLLLPLSIPESVEDLSISRAPPLQADFLSTTVPDSPFAGFA